MSTYDTISMPGTPADGAQVKLWGCEMAVYGVGDEIPHVGYSHYGVVLREGGAILVDFDILGGWVREFPTDRPLFDKWGSFWCSPVRNVGIMGENYWFDHTKAEGERMSVPTEEEKQSMFCPFDGQRLDIDSVITEPCPNCDIEWEWRPKDSCLVLFNQPEDRPGRPMGTGRGGLLPHAPSTAESQRS